MLGIGNWLWIDEGDAGGSWSQPGAIGTLDLASLAQIESAQPGQPRGVGVFQFATDADLKEFTNAGGTILTSEDARDGTTNGKGLDAIESLLGYRPQGDTWADCLYDVLTNGADPANLDAPGILVPTTAGKLELWLAGSLYRSDAFDFATNPLSNKLATLIKFQLNAYRAAALAGKMISPVTKQPDLEYHLRIADAMCEKYAGRDAQRKADLFAVLKPVEWDAAEQPKPHATTITDDFNRADQSGLGTATAGWSWSALSSSTDSQILSNEASSNNVGGVSEWRADSSLSSSDNYSQVDIIAGPASNTFIGVFCRKDANSTRTFYDTDQSSTTNRILRKRVSGSGTVLRTDTIALSLPDTAKVQANGSTIQHFYDGASLGSSTDTAITTGLQCGLMTGFNASGVTRLDSFEAGDLGAAARLAKSYFTPPIAVINSANI